MNTRNLSKHRSAAAVGLVACLVALAGCQGPGDASEAAVRHGEDFSRDGDVGPAQRFAAAQAAAGARQEATLRDYHFEGPDLNSLGEEKLLMILDGWGGLDAGEVDNNNTADEAGRAAPQGGMVAGDRRLVVYLDLKEQGEELARGRWDTVSRFLQDEGVAAERVRLKAGHNPAATTPAVDGLRSLGQLDASVPADASRSNTESKSGSGDGVGSLLGN